MRRQILLFLVLLISFVPLSSSVVVYNDLDTAFKIAELQQKQLILMFSDKNCYYCVKFIDDTIPDSRVQELLKAGYVFVEIQRTNETAEFKLNGDFETYTYADLYTVFGIRGTPTFMFFDERREPVTNLVGHVQPQFFVSVLQFLGKKAYLDGTTFQAFLQQEHDYTGSQAIVTLSEEATAFILDHDQNARRFREETEPDRFTVWITDDSEEADLLIQFGVFRVIREIHE